MRYFKMFYFRHIFLVTVILLKCFKLRESLIFLTTTGQHRWTCRCHGFFCPAVDCDVPFPREDVFENGDELDPLYTPGDQYWGVHVSSCGHMMHSDCWQGFYKSVVVKERRALRMGQYHVMDIAKGEYLCPIVWLHQQHSPSSLACPV